MTVGVLLITHAGVARALLDCATQLFGESAAPVRYLEVGLDADMDALGVQASAMVDEIDTGDGVLILTDLHGASPSNLACTLVNAHKACVISGVNMPMLARVFNYRLAPLPELREKVLLAAASGAVATDPGEQSV